MPFVSILKTVISNAHLSSLHFQTTLLETVTFGDQLP
jgi:hypothetical protein